MAGIAIRMLFGDCVKLLGIMLGMTLATLLIAQQGGLFYGLIKRSQNVIADAGDVDLWVMHPTTQRFNLAKPMATGSLMQIRGISGVAWASPLLNANLVVSGAKGARYTALLLGADDVTLRGIPEKFILGNINSLRGPEAIAIDRVGFLKLWPGEPLKLGKVLELNDRRAVVRAITDAAPAFSSQVIIHARRSNALRYVPIGRRNISFVLVGVANGHDPIDTANRIAATTGLRALTSQGFSSATIDYYLRNTGITINFATTILLGVIVGMAIVGLTFGLFVTDNLAHYALLKMLGVTNQRLVAMALLQVGIVALIGYIFGIGLAVGFFELVSAPTSALRGFYLPWWIPVVTLVVMVVSVLLSTMIGLRRVLKVDPAIVFRGQT